ncbi:hypothetical protein Scep_026966 [Stephania cephalantha]|uniref:Uncharacterized protein n=1 Tax=Stephania cephalantha TaxID=152367 RepID=A0AAP0EPC1_9MAGN
MAGGLRKLTPPWGADALCRVDTSFSGCPGPSQKAPFMALESIKGLPPSTGDRGRLELRRVRTAGWPAAAWRGQHDAEAWISGSRSVGGQRREQRGGGQRRELALWRDRRRDAAAGQQCSGAAVTRSIGAARTASVPAAAAVWRRELRLADERISRG